MWTKKLFLQAICVTTLGALLTGCAPTASPTPAAKPPAKADQVSTPVARTPAALPAPSSTPKPAAQQPKYGGIVNRLRENYPDSLDPHLSRGASHWNDILGPLYNGLFTLNEKMEIVPDLVEKWEQPSELTYLLRLRQGTKFHDNPVMKGREFTAEDVKYNIQRIATDNPKFFSRWQFQTVASLEVVDKYTVRLTLKEPTAAFMDYMAQPFNYMVGREAVERFGELNREEAGTGPFYLKSWTEKISYKLARNPSYFIKGVPYLDEVNVVIVPDYATRLAAFRSGRADYVLLSYTDYSAIKRTMSKIEASRLPSSVIFLALHPEKSPFTDQRVRQAFSLAIDRQAVIDVAMEGEAELTGPIYGVSPTWQLPPEELKRIYIPDVARARKLMADSGYPNGFPLEIKASSRRKDAMDALTVVAEQLKQIGVNVKQQVLEHTTLVAQRNAGDFVAVLHAVTAAIEPGERVEHHWGRSGLYLLKDDPELVDLVDEQRRTVDASKRRQILNKFERTLIDRAYLLYLFGYGQYLVRQPYISGPREPSVLSQNLMAHHWLDR
ncbi:MAG: hypothetical protein HYX92_22810 [Chloroflexi bacterium]|nr:hypothetical protein [Chloroflexota bacterium]